jgi:hypothetical protein
MHTKLWSRNPEGKSSERYGHVQEDNIKMELKQLVRLLIRLSAELTLELTCSVYYRFHRSLRKFVKRRKQFNVAEDSDNGTGEHFSVVISYMGAGEICDDVLYSALGTIQLTKLTRFHLLEWCKRDLEGATFGVRATVLFSRDAGMTKSVVLAQLPGNTRSDYNNPLEVEKERPLPSSSTCRDLGAAGRATTRRGCPSIHSRERHNTREQSQRTVSNTVFTSFGGGAEKREEVVPLKSNIFIYLSLNINILFLLHLM